MRSYVLAVTLAASLCSAETLLLSEPPSGGQACALDRTDTQALLFAVEDHAASIARQIDECKTLRVTAGFNTKDNHITYWENLIYPQVASIKDLLDQVMATDDIGVARKIAPHATALEEYTAAVIQLLGRARMGPDDRSYPLFLAAASQRAEQIVHLIEMSWDCAGAAMDVGAPPPTRAGTDDATRRPVHTAGPLKYGH
jgi:hypothetical protein